MKLIVTGTGRCGTGYLASVLNAAGLACGHEGAFGPRGHTGGAGRDCSWMAAPFLADHLEARRVLLWREPADVIASFLGIGFFERDTAWRRFQREYADGGWGMPFQEACNHYVEWNQMALQHCTHVVALHDINWSAVAGDEYDEAAFRRAVALVPSHVNTRERAELPSRLPEWVLRTREQLAARTS